MPENSTNGNAMDYDLLLKEALRALEKMRNKLSDAEKRSEASAHQPIAIVGIGCRFPGGAEDVESFWEFLKDGGEAIAEVPRDRWNADEYHDVDVTKPGKMVSRYGAFLEGIDRFDAAFFGIAPREAAMMDPQQRLLLEVAWHAFEDAGIAPRSLEGSATGVYLGIASGDYAQLQLKANDLSLLDVHYASGNAHSVASGRLSYLLGLKGPSLSIDTACSSSLVAVHLACRALRSGECTMALAGGVNLILAPETTIALSQAHMLAPDGRSKVFDDRADGFSRGEGCGVVVLKPLNRAVADGDRIYAVIRGTALNQDGASSSLTAPHGPSQEQLIRHALADAQMTAERIGYVEAHGTGTPLGDPIELQAVGAVYGQVREASSPLLIGSLKTNVGHMEAAAGIGGLIKLVLALKNGQIPAHLQFEKPTRHVAWNTLRLAVPRTAMSWPEKHDVAGKRLPRAGGVSSFGFSGTNVHLIVEEGPGSTSPSNSDDDSKPSERAKLPLHAFDRKRYWFNESPLNEARRVAAGVAPQMPRSQWGGHASAKDGDPLLGRRVHTRSEYAVFQSELSTTWPIDLGQHVIDGRRVLPGSAYLEMAVSAGAYFGRSGDWRVLDIEFSAPCFFDDARRLETLLHPIDAVGARIFEIASKSLDEIESEWIVHARGSLSAVGTQDARASAIDVAGLQHRAEKYMDNAEFYGRFDQVGLSFGHAFRTVKRAWCGPDEGLVELRSPEAIQAERCGYSIDPMLLDACLQSAAALSGSEESGTLALPAQVGSFRILDRTVSICFALAQMRNRNERGLTVDVTGLDLHGNAVLEVKGLVLVAVRERELEDWLYEIDWENSESPETWQPEAGVDFADEGRSLELDGDAVTSALQSALAHEIRQRDVRDFERWMGAFDRLCAGWIAWEFERGGFALSEGREFGPGDVIRDLSVAPEHECLVRRFLEVLVEFSYLERPGQGLYRVLHRPKIGVDEEAAKLALPGHPEFEWTARAASRLSSLLRGELAAVDVLFWGDGVRIAGGLYRHSVSARSLNRALAAAAYEAASQVNEEGRKLCVIELGAGTGATTSYLLPALGESLAKYVWTDIGAGFVATARQEFGATEAMRFQTLDIEADLEGQGLAGRTFDIVVASNVLHATADLRKTLRRVGSLMRPGGLLLIAETTATRPWIDMTVGFTQGWWRFRDFDLRTDSPLIGNDAWSALLHESGFEGISIASSEAGGALGDQSLIVAFAPAEAAKNKKIGVHPSRGRVVLVTGSIHGDRSEWAELLMKLAKDSGAHVLLAGREDVSAEKIDSYLGARNDEADGSSANTSIIYLPGVEMPVSRDKSGIESLQWQEAVLGGALLWTQALLGSTFLSSSRLWLVSRGAGGRVTTDPNGATLSALARSVRSEQPGAQVFAVDVSGANEAIESEVKALWKICTDSHEPEGHYAIEHGAVWVPRLTPLVLPVVKSEQLTRRVRFSSTGLIDDLKIRLESRVDCGADEVEIAIVATAINFHEVLESLNAERRNDIAPGGECTGVVTRVGDNVRDMSEGEEVVAIGTGLMADYATLPRNRFWKKPVTLNHEQCTTLIVPFLTARWSLLRVARLKAGETVLIHSAAGGVGLAAIQEAHRAGAVVIATAGTEEKRAYLRDIGIAMVFDSRTEDFKNGVMEATVSRGVDVVLNSLSGVRAEAGMQCLAAGGRFVELGEVDATTESDARAMRPDVAYYRIHLRESLLELTQEVRAEISGILEDAEAGCIEALSYRSYELDDVVNAFRYMSSGGHVGRVLMTGAKRTSPDPRRFSGFKRDGAYVVTGAFKGLGKLIVKWLAEQGAGYVLALGRSEPDEEMVFLCEELRRQGTGVGLKRCDVTNEAALSNAMDGIPEPYRLRGVFHAAGVLEEAALDRQSWDKFHSVLSPKLAGAWNLHRLTESIDLDCFVLFSSAAGVLGARGQSNHAAGSAYLDALARYRRDVLGKTALSVDWGAWSGTGAAIRHNAVQRGERSGVRAISPVNGTRLLRRLMDQDATQVIALPVNWQQWAARSKTEAAANRHLLKRMMRSDDETIVAMGIASTVSNETQEPQHERLADGFLGWREGLLALPEAQRMLALTEHLEQRIRDVLSMGPEDSLDEKRPLQEYGLDSLLSIELRNVLSKDLGSKLPNTALFDYPTIAALKSWLYRDVLDFQAEQAGLDGAEGTIETSSYRDLALLSEEEVDRLLQQRMARSAQ